MLINIMFFPGMSCKHFNHPAKKSEPNCFLFIRILCCSVPQINNLWEIVPAEPGDRFLSMLPPWHAYERACEYFIFSYGIQQVYTTVKYLKVGFIYVST